MPDKPQVSNFNGMENNDILTMTPEKSLQFMKTYIHT